MSIGTAKPSPEELAMVPHYFIDSHSVNESLNARDFEHLALGYLHQIFSTNDVAIVCGGTGLYIKALCEGIDDMPDTDRQIEEEIQRQFREMGLEWLQEQLRQKDPEFFAQAEQQNPVRLIRALAFFESNKESIMRYRKAQAKPRDFKVIKIALNLPREVLYTRINRRVDLMMQQGLLQEVSSLYTLRHLKNLQTVGYSEFYEAGPFPLGEEQLAQAVDKVKQHTRNYAKRQLTWLKKDKEFVWFAPDEWDAVTAYIKSNL